MLYLYSIYFNGDYTSFQQIVFKVSYFYITVLILSYLTVIFVFNFLVGHTH